jgi:hypothetical protein
MSPGTTNRPTSKEHSIHVQTNTGCSFLNMHALVLKVLSNSVRVYMDTVEPKDVSIPIEDDFWRTALQTCRRNIQLAAQVPCVAAISMNLMAIVLRNSLSKGSTHSWLGNAAALWSDVQKAHAWGQLHHSKLEQAAQELMNVLLDEGKNDR